MPKKWNVRHHHVAIRVREINASIEFYRDILGLPLLRTAPDGENPGMAWFPGLQLIQNREESDNAPDWRFAHLGFETNNVEKAVEELRARGLKFQPHEQGRPWFLEDPDGVLIELMV